MSATIITDQMERLLNAVQQLSLARDIDTIANIVRTEARELTGADGATFVLREGDLCYYVDENAIAPLWKGKRFPMRMCISGWVMEHQEAVIIKDIYADPRIPVEAYRPTFVKSLAMVPIRKKNPIGAIGNYWAKQYQPTKKEMNLLQALADSTSIAIENVQLYTELEQRVKDRTLQLQNANRELEAFSYSVSHDLKAPLRVIEGFNRALREDYGTMLDDQANEYFQHITDSIKKMNTLIDDLLKLSRLTIADMSIKQINLSQMVHDTLSKFLANKSGKKVNIEIETGIMVNADPGLIQIVLDNLLSNAIKFTSQTAEPGIKFGIVKPQEGEKEVYYIQDNGVGFDMKNADKLFSPFRRLHNAKEFPGNGIGLATTARIIHRHGGSIWAVSEPGKKTTFYFTL